MRNWKKIKEGMHSIAFSVYSVTWSKAPSECWFTKSELTSDDVNLNFTSDDVKSICFPYLFERQFGC